MSNAISAGESAILANLLDAARQAVDAGERGEAQACIAQALRTVQPDVDEAAIPDLAALSEALIKRQLGLFQVCAILRCAARRGDDVNSEADTLYAIEAAGELLTPIAEGLDLAVLRQEAQGGAS